MISKSVDFGLSSRARKIILNTCSSFGFRLAQKNFLKISINHFANICFDSSGPTSRGFMQNGNCSSVGSKIITSSLRDTGICVIISSMSSQSRSITPIPFPCFTSLIMRLSKNFDFPVPVLPTTYTCLSLSSS